MSKRVAVVTGANKGIGYEIVKELCKKFDGVVYLTARNPELGKAAVEALKKEKLNPQFHQLDITDQESINKLRDYLQSKYNGFDVLVNNAGYAYLEIPNAVQPLEQVEKVMHVNFYSTLNLCQTLFPLLRPHARVVNLSSVRGMLGNLPSLALKERFAAPGITIEDLKTIMVDCFTSFKENTLMHYGWSPSPYNMSKMAICCMTKIHQKDFDSDSRPDIIVNSVNPGFVDTDTLRLMRKKKVPPVTPAKGAEVPSYLALLPPNVSSPKGEFVWHDKSIEVWGRRERFFDDSDDEF